MLFVAIFYFHVLDNFVADSCKAQLWQPGLFNTIIDKLTDNFTKNINIANIEISKFGNCDRGCTVALKPFCPEFLSTVLKFNSTNI